MWYLLALVVLSGIVMWFVGRQQRSDFEGAMVNEVGEMGLLIEDRLVEWDSVYDVRVRTGRSRRSAWFGFDIRSEEAGLIRVEGADGLGERFLAHAYLLPGFDHDGVRRALEANRSDVVCFSR